MTVLATATSYPMFPRPKGNPSGPRRTGRTGGGVERVGDDPAIVLRQGPKYTGGGITRPPWPLAGRLGDPGAKFGHSRAPFVTARRGAEVPSDEQQAPPCQQASVLIGVQAAAATAFRDEDVIAVPFDHLERLATGAGQQHLAARIAKQSGR